MPDNGTAGVSIAGKLQVIAFQKLDLIVSIDISITGNHKIRFGKREAVSIGIIKVSTLLGNITVGTASRVPRVTLALAC
jgi:hypothetical protein